MTILISSYSKAYDIWPITDYFLKKNFNCETEFYLGANGENKKEFVPERWKYINKGEDVTFSKSLNDYLEEIEDEYFILMLDDFAILEPVDCSLIKRAFDFIKEKNGVYLRLAPNPGGDEKIDRYFSRIAVEKKVPYVTSLQMAIWKKEFLKELLKYDFNPWEFETKAGKTSESLTNYDKFFVTNFPFVKYTHFVEKGKFFPVVKSWLNQKNIIIDSSRSFWSEEEIKKMQDSFLKRNLRKLIPKTIYNKLRNTFGLGEL
ncbi:hypothetical protein [Caminibacter pacificus]|uniref:Uncharacterized protein n=1 Tax=Caminibacter pacificus TaxID=1424653 RepID=A0AAJ4UXI2_9BACT|nr:hypothetical protein [Caminibacter pacificus]ROR39160.1 hypothetical protein EDC58_1658 [Caminibacter pacificus]